MLSFHCRGAPSLRGIETINISNLEMMLATLYCRDMPTLRRIETITSSSNFLWLDAIADAVFQTDLLTRCHAFKMKERNSGINKNRPHNANVMRPVSDSPASLTVPVY